MQYINQTLEAIGGIVAVGGAASAIAWAFFTFLGKKWLDAKFDERLESFRIEKAKEIEQLRHEISSLYSRISKVHEKEFEVIPTVWLKFHEAYGRVFTVVSSLRQHPALNRYSQAEVEEFLNGSRLREFEKDEIRGATDKEQYYLDRMFWIELADAKSAQNGFHNYLIGNRLFVPADLREKLNEADKLLGGALVAKEVTHETTAPELLGQISFDMKKLETLVPEIEKLAQSRLRYEEA